MERPGLLEIGVLVELVGQQPGLVRQLGLFPEGFFLAGNQHVLQAQHLVLPAVVVDEAATGHAVGAAGEQVAGKLDDHQTVMLFAHLGLQVAAPARLGAVQELPLVGRQRCRQGRFVVFPGHFQQGALDDRVQLRFVGELQGVDVYQGTLFALTAGLQVLAGEALGGQRVVEAGLEEALAGAQQNDQAAEGGEFQKAHGIPFATVDGRARSVDQSVSTLASRLSSARANPKYGLAVAGKHARAASATKFSRAVLKVAAPCAGPR
ncbi:hypothetical protein Y880_0494101 [Pseudomonas aeruginosa PAK]|nr:hypothetical protein Y880_0494101 [Pseudomonas aeruginosa PAK]